MERATCPFLWATSPQTETGRAVTLDGDDQTKLKLGGKLPPRTAKLAVPPNRYCIDSAKRGSRAKTVNPSNASSKRKCCFESLSSGIHVKIGS